MGLFIFMKGMDMPRYIKEQDVVVRVRSYVEADNLDEAIVKAYYWETTDREFVFVAPADEITDDFRIRREDSDDWTVARERARERGYHVDESISVEQLADKIYRVAQRLERTDPHRFENAVESLVYAPGLPDDLRQDAIARARGMIENEGNGRWGL